ncbi:MAG: SGNH/GDSL hydrolase family protein [Chloroflexi bacterium]|nr:SGNH/GDSL hydrolase family protein [Chloroflexota bacterium]
MPSICKLFCVSFALLAIALAGLACGDSEEETQSVVFPEFANGAAYVALGDSIAAGTGASDAETTNYVSLVAEALRDRLGVDLELINLAEGGASTEILIEQQLPAALERLAQGDVLLVTITVSGIDLNQLADTPVCVQDPADIGCPIDDLLLGVEERLNQMIRDLQEAGPDTLIVIQLYPNLFSGSGHELERSADTAFELLNGAITGVANRNDVILADPRHPFEGASSRLTHLLDPTPDAHPSDAGYRVIADAFLEALGLAEE